MMIDGSASESVVAEVVHYKLTDDRVAWLTIDRPQARNALNQSVRVGLWDGFARFEADDDAAVLVLTATGSQAFSAGADYKELEHIPLGLPDPNFMPELGRNIDVSKPVIAAANGLAYGAGFCLCQMCDLVIASETATFATPEARWGRGMPWAISLAWTAPPRVALEMMLSGRPISAQRAYELGLVNMVVPAAELEETARRLAAEIGRNAPLSVRAAKRMLYATARLDFPEGYAVAEEIFHDVYFSEDSQEGARAFREKREPVWKGT
jgi:enoyl-CoA hydratase/carnithine racemase